MSDETIDQVATEEQPQDDGWEWAVVEVFGHRKHAGRMLDGRTHDDMPRRA